MVNLKKGHKSKESLRTGMLPQSDFFLSFKVSSNIKINDSQNYEQKIFPRNKGWLVVVLGLFETVVPSVLSHIHS